MSGVSPTMAIYVAKGCRREMNRTVFVCLYSVIAYLWGPNVWVNAFATPGTLAWQGRSVVLDTHQGFLAQARVRDDSETSESDYFSEVVATLDLVHKGWKNVTAINPEWSKLVLPQEPGLTNQSPATGGSESNRPRDFVWILKPPMDVSPSCILVFTGGAGLGRFPQLAYNELLTRLSNRLGAVCIAAPFQVGLDHFALAQYTGDLHRRATIHCQDNLWPNNTDLPIYSLSHSLGCKLQTIYVGATKQPFDKIGFISYNSFSIGQALGTARTFANQFRNKPEQSGDKDEPRIGVLHSLFDFAEKAASAIGIDVSPTSEEMHQLIKLRFDESLQAKTRLFVFDNDILENSRDFMQSCTGEEGPSCSGLPGGHLTPVLLKPLLENIGKKNSMLGEDVPPDQVIMGDEGSLNQLVDEVCSWISGKPPTRGPHWVMNHDIRASRTGHLV